MPWFDARSRHLGAGSTVTRTTSSNQTLFGSDRDAYVVAGVLLWPSSIGDLRASQRKTLPAPPCAFVAPVRQGSPVFMSILCTRPYFSNRSKMAFSGASYSKLPQNTCRSLKKRSYYYKTSIKPKADVAGRAAVLLSRGSVPTPTGRSGLPRPSSIVSTAV